MDRRRNPYAPGAGLQPPELAGRDKFIEDAIIDMERALAKRPTKGMVLLGLRGVGKTVLLNRLFASANEMGFETIKIEAPEGGALPRLLAPEMRRVLYALDLKAAAGAKLRQAVAVLRNFVGAFKMKIGEIDFGIEAAPGRGDTGNLQQDLPVLMLAIAEAAAEKNSAIGLFLDEVQYLSADELAAVIVGCHELSQRNLPFLFIGAGLPQVAALAGNAKSYAERLFNYPEVGALDADAARSALQKPAESEGVRFEDDVIEAMLHATERYPYFIQEWGFHAWNAAPSNPVERRVVEEITPQIIAHLDANFFRVRFDRLTALQQKYLRAMAELGPGPHKTGDIAATLGVEPSAVATVRQQLIDKGMIWSQRFGETAFTVPMFDTFMKRQMPKLEQHVPRRRTRKAAI
jgi:AAA ATPase-like protein